MTTTTRERPEFETVQLAIEPNEAHELVQQTLKGLRASDTESGILLRTSHGMLVAILDEHSTPSEEQQTELAYRVAPLSESATRKGKKVFEILESHRA
ncbi:hypothetical protein [Haladaptatus sp. NG-SE-30]